MHRTKNSGLANKKRRGLL